MKLFTCNGQSFSTKKAAKDFRDTPQGAGSSISVGPDHWRFGVKGNPRTHSHNSRSGGPGNGFPK